jgi:conjugal transfer/entry exclusion protein
MTIKQALKEKNKLTKQIQSLVTRIQKYNSMEEGSVRTYEPREDMDTLTQTVSQLVYLKTQIHQANSKVYDKIFRLSEYKGLVKYLRVIDCTEGKTNESRRYGESATIVKTTIFGQIEMDNLITYYESEIEKIQEELDVHNATTHI